MSTGAGRKIGTLGEWMLAAVLFFAAIDSQCIMMGIVDPAHWQWAVATALNGLCLIFALHVPCEALLRVQDPEHTVSLLLGVVALVGAAVVERTY